MTSLREARERAGFGRSRFARLVGIGEGDLYRYETGKKHPRFETAVRLASALDIGIEEIAEFAPALKKAESRRVEELMEEVREQVLSDGREVHIAIGDLPNWLRDELKTYARQNPDRVRHLTLDLSLEEMQELAGRPKAAPASRYGEAI